MNTLSLYLITVLVWGTTWFAITFQLHGAPIATSVGYRFVLAGLLLLGWCRWRGIALPRGARAHGWLVLMGLTYSINYFLVYYCELFLNSGLVAVALSTIVLSNVLLSRWFFGTKITRGLLLGIGFGIAGIALVFWPQISHGGLLQSGGGASSLLALFWCVVAALGASLANMIAVRNQNAGIALLPGNGLWMLYMGGFMLLVNAFSGGTFAITWSAPYLLSLAYLAVFGSIVAFGCYLTLFSRIGATRASYVSILTPLVALVFATLFEDFQWQPIMVLGVIILLIGQWLTIQSKAGWQWPPALRWHSLRRADIRTENS